MRYAAEARGVKPIVVAFSARGGGRPWTQPLIPPSVPVPCSRRPRTQPPTPPSYWRWAIAAASPGCLVNDAIKAGVQCDDGRSGGHGGGRYRGTTALGLSSHTARLSTPIPGVSCLPSVCSGMRDTSPLLAGSTTCRSNDRCNRCTRRSCQCHRWMSTAHR